MMRRCAVCSGYRTVISAALKRRPGRRVGAVLIPWHACQSCRAEAEAAFARLQADRSLEYVYWQDLAEDRYLCYVNRKS
jgi:hypothetical protein